MALKTLVQVGMITNLSDARYCAGMGAAMLGFTVVEGQLNFIDPPSYQAIRGWVSGPGFVAEVYGLQRDTISVMIQNYAPDFLELSPSDFAQLTPDISVPLIISINTADELEAVRPWINKIAYLIIEPGVISEASVETLAKEYPLLLRITDERHLLLLDKFDIKGITLLGGQEIRPGLKDYDNLELIFDQLEASE
jgi:phosphoribosylanthranilate isomerase